MREVCELENNAIDDEDDMGSLNHSIIQANLSGLLKFKCDRNLVVMNELSLDISQYDLTIYELGTKDEIKPDVCAYRARPAIPKGKNDLIKVSQMPDLVVEILSPRQAVDYLIRKIHAYFELGVSSCWLVMPTLDEIRVFSQPRTYQTYGLHRDTEVVDDVMGIRLPVVSIFSD